MADRSETGHPGQPQAGLAPGLYVVATPIGNLGDLTERARHVLSQADLVLCEDKRVTGRLLDHFAIRVPLLAYHEHSAARLRPGILRRLQEGARIALVSDAGTPTLADPGYKLVRAAGEAGIPVRAVPGPSAILAALSVCGLPTDRFFFQGFLPARSAARRRVLEELRGIPATLVLFEAPHRLRDSLEDCAAVLGNREACIARELTKRYEEVRRGSLAELARMAREEAPPRGEMVLVIAPPAAGDLAPSDEEVDEMLRQALAHGGVRDAAAEVAELTGLPRRQLYRRALTLAGQRHEER